MKKFAALMVAVSLLLLVKVLARAEMKRPLKVVPSVDLKRYSGQWFEIARFPNGFQKKCAGEVIATYTLRPTGKLTVMNQCRMANGRISEAKGEGRVTSKQGPNSILEVRFAPSFLSFLPFVWGDYQIIELADDYTHAVVGTPDRKYLWILSRSPRIDEMLYQQLATQAREQGFDVGRLQRTRQTQV